MKTTTERTAENSAVLTIELEPEDQKRVMERGYRLVAKRANIPGFRPGKAPRPLVERFFGVDTILHEGLDQELNTILNQAMQEAKIRPYGQPSVDLESHEPIVIKATIALFPEVELGDYHSVRVPRETVVIDNADIDASINNLRERFATWDEVTDRGIRWGDRATLDITYFPTDSPESTTEQTGIDYPVEAESTRPFPRFADQLIGMMSGETREFTNQFGEDETTTAWKNKEITFRVTLKGIKEKHLPESDEDLAKKEGRFENFATLREAVATELKEQGEHTEQHRLEDAVLAAVAERATVNIPQQMIENQVDVMIDDRLDAFTMFGLPRPTKEQYLTSAKISEEELREELRPQARERLVNALVLQKIADQEQVDVSNEEIEAEIGRLAASAGQNAGQVRRYYRDQDRRDTIRFRLRQQKALEHLVKMAAPEETPVEAASPIARMLLGQDQPESALDEPGMVRTSGGLVLPAYARTTTGQQEQPNTEAAAEQAAEATGQAENTPE